MIDVRDMVRDADAVLGREWDHHESLMTAAERFGVPPEAAHHALADAFVTAQLFLVTRALLDRGDATPGRSTRLPMPRRAGSSLRGDGHGTSKFAPQRVCPAS
jgi:DNA polymerase III epsilon subunit-like protein